MLQKKSDNGIVLKQIAQRLRSIERAANRLIHNHFYLSERLFSELWVKYFVYENRV
jgi:hypothetical protein